MTTFKQFTILSFVLMGFVLSENSLSIENVVLPSAECEDVSDLAGNTCDTILNVLDLLVIKNLPGLH